MCIASRCEGFFYEDEGTQKNLHWTTLDLLLSSVLGEGFMLFVNWEIIHYLVSRVAVFRVIKMQGLLPNNFIPQIYECIHFEYGVLIYILR